jgi:ABC-type amino acid transport substrate-binding protein
VKRGLNNLDRSPDRRRTLASLRTRWLLLGALIGIVIVVASLWLLWRTLPESADPTWERILQTGVIPVCTDPSWPPFESIDGETGQLRGFDIDLAQLLAIRLASVQQSDGIQAEFITVGFDSLYDALLSGRCDIVLSALPYEPMRTEDVTYSLAYFNGGLVIVVQEETTDIGGMEDLAGRVVGVEWGFVPEGDSEQRIFLQNLGLRRYETAAETLRALQGGEVAAVIVDRISALAYLRDCTGLRIVGEPIADLNYVIPMRPESYRLIEEVSRVLLELREEGVLDELQQKWF